ncbi:uncharacterized protein LOC133894835 isoform X2 [Phragmites australis]|uniref:uncharacterized protein LOC133894835 isoform X2 n=1 Tax=Phragmites australis TaxID=29695 RepID=UPI002D784449|nr:uncharacterized protein LOC133894835 isoform X2 [Phragmites australis]
MARRHHLLLLLPLFLALAAAAAASGHGQGHGEASAVFIDGASHRYLRNQQGDGQDSSMSLNEVSAVVSVLLGFAPPTSLPTRSSSQLNKVLLPNPFDRPRAVFLLQIDGSHADSFISEASSSFKTRIEGANTAATGLTDKDELIVIHSDESLDVSRSDYLDNELSNLANWLEGSYQKSSGKLVIPLESGNSLTLLLDKEADSEFASSLVSLLKTIERGIQVHEDFSGVVSPAELLVCHLTGIKGLEDEYGSTEIVKQRTEVIRRAFTKAFESLLGAYKGKIVGLVISTKEASPSLGSIIDAPSSLLISRRLEEASQTNAIALVLLVRKSLAWITGIILLVSTLIGVCLLMNMPLTRDTLLYSNVKID